MRQIVAIVSVVAAVVVSASSWAQVVQLGPRPFFLVDQLPAGPLKTQLERCVVERTRYAHHDFSIGHRGAPLQFPEHTRESYLAAHRMGAGIIECDVTFTKDKALVCRHAQCDLHRSTNILVTPLADRCEVAFSPATFAADGRLKQKAQAKCCASALTLAEFKTLRGKMDGFNERALTPVDALDATAAYRTDLYVNPGTLMSHRESIRLIDSLGAKFTPELKGIDKAVGFGESGLNQSRYASAIVADYRAEQIDPSRVFLQSFSPADIAHWLKAFPEFGRQAVWLDGRRVSSLAASPPDADAFAALYKQGLRYLAPPIPVLLKRDGNELVASDYARRATAAGLKLITWTTERSGRIENEVLKGRGQYYYQTLLPAMQNDGDILTVIDALAKEAGVVGIFSDWAATTTFYANCALDN
ncbi:MAG: glycerophosphodiester phosphodiesterase family protein [Pseudomonadota bacterium]